MSALVPLLNADFGIGSVPVPGGTIRVGRLHVEPKHGNGYVERLYLDEDRSRIVAENNGKRRLYPLTAAIGGVEPTPEAPKA